MYQQNYKEVINKLVKRFGGTYEEFHVYTDYHILSMRFVNQEFHITRKPKHGITEHGKTFAGATNAYNGTWEIMETDDDTMALVIKAADMWIHMADIDKD